VKVKVKMVNPVMAQCGNIERCTSCWPVMVMCRFMCGLAEVDLSPVPTSNNVERIFCKISSFLCILLQIYIMQTK